MMSIYSMYCTLTLILLSNGAEESTSEQKNSKNWLYTESDISELPTDIQIALKLLTNEGLQAIGAAALPTTEIYYGIIEYFQSSWDECGWVDGLAGSIQFDMFKWEESNNIIKNGHNGWCEIEETFHPFSVEDIDNSTPKELQIEISNLLKNGLQCIARFKYDAWNEYGILWNDAFVSKLGLQNDNELFSEFDTQLNNLLNNKEEILYDKINKNPRNIIANAKGSKSSSSKTECQLRNPIIIMAPYLNGIGEVWSKIFGNGELDGSSTCASISWGAQVCASNELETCLGGGFGFLACANGKGFIFRESKLDIDEDISTFTDASAKLIIEMSLYNNIEDAIGGKLTKEASDSMENQWLAQPRIIYNENNNAIGVTFAGDVHINEGIIASGDPLGSVVVDPLAFFEFGNDNKNLQLFGENFELLTINNYKKNNENQNDYKYNYYYYLLIGGFIIFAIFMILIVVTIKRKYYWNKLSGNKSLVSLIKDSEYIPLLK